MNLIIGMGEIGSAVAQVLLDAGYKVSTLDLNSEPVNGDIEVLHICFPYTQYFLKEVKKYRVKYKPKLTIIYSSVPIGTTKQIPHAIHCPIEGKHPRLNFGVKAFRKFIGYNDPKDGFMARDLWKPISEFELLPNSDWTEFLKLASTSKYGINIVWADYMGDTAERLDMPYDYVKDWDRAYNNLYGRMKEWRYRKFVLDPPDGWIGGHCIVSNAELLNESYPEGMLDMIIELGDPLDNL